MKKYIVLLLSCLFVCALAFANEPTSDTTAQAASNEAASAPAEKAPAKKAAKKAKAAKKHAAAAQH